MEITEYQIIATAVKIGKILIESGAETCKVEESITRICKYYGVVTKPFVIPTCIMCSAKNSKGEIFSYIERINKSSTNLDKVHEVTKLITEINQYDYHEFIKKIGKISRKNGYSKKRNLIAYIGVTSFFALIFNGGIKEFIISGLSGFVLFYWIRLAEYIKINHYFKILVGGAISSMVVFFLFRLGLNGDITISVISSFMLMVPGIAFTNGIRDLISGDFVSGITRGIEALLIAASLAVGSGFTLYILMKLGEI